MPFVNVKLIEGVFTSEQKQRIVRDLTETMVAIEGENMRQVTWVVVEEVHSGDWGIAGQPLSTAESAPAAAGRPERREVLPYDAVMSESSLAAARRLVIARAPHRSR